MVLSGIKYNFRPKGVKGCGSFAIFGASRRMYPSTRCGYLRRGAIVKGPPGKMGRGWGITGK